jgi:sorbitol-specific phosphotransferase system component IIBC
MLPGIWSILVSRNFEFRAPRVGTVLMLRVGIVLIAWIARIGIVLGLGISTVIMLRIGIVLSPRIGGLNIGIVLLLETRFIMVLKVAVTWIPVIGFA